jgi:hypothetical protein
MDLTDNLEEAHRSVLHADNTATGVYNICCIILRVHLSCGAAGLTLLSASSSPTYYWLNTLSHSECALLRMENKLEWSCIENNNKTIKQTPWTLERERSIPTERPRLSAKLAPTSADRGCCVISTTDPYGRILGFLD